MDGDAVEGERTGFWARLRAAGTGLHQATYVVRLPDRDHSRPPYAVPLLAEAMRRSELRTDERPGGQGR